MKYFKLIRTIFWWIIALSCVVDLAIIVSLNHYTNEAAHDGAKNTLIAMAIKSVWLAWSHWRWGKEAKQS